MRFKKISSIISSVEPEPRTTSLSFHTPRASEQAGFQWPYAHLSVSHVHARTSPLIDCVSALEKALGLRDWIPGFDSYSTLTTLTDFEYFSPIVYT